MEPQTFSVVDNPGASGDPVIPPPKFLFFIVNFHMSPQPTQMRNLFGGKGGYCHESLGNQSMTEDCIVLHISQPAVKAYNIDTTTKKTGVYLFRSYPRDINGPDVYSLQVISLHDLDCGITSHACYPLKMIAQTHGFFKEILYSVKKMLLCLALIISCAFYKRNSAFLNMTH